MVEFELGTNDDDWLSAGMELNLIQDAVCVGVVEDQNTHTLNDEFNPQGHHLLKLSHLGCELGSRGRLGDAFRANEPGFREYREFFDMSVRSGLIGMNHRPFVLDFDLDCFSVDCLGNQMAWPYAIFKEKYVDSDQVKTFMHELIDHSLFVTICRELGCCGGLGESNKILSYLDRHFFDGVLRTKPIM